MATKRFMKLPKAAKRAAFAKMAKDAVVRIPYAKRFAEGLLVDKHAKRYANQTFQELSEIKKRLYSKADIGSAMSMDEKAINRAMSIKASEMNEAARQRRAAKMAGK